MRSVQITNTSEDLDGLELLDTEMPSLGNGQVLVKMKMASVNPSDLNFIRGDYEVAMSRAIWNQQGEMHINPHNPAPFPAMPFAIGGEGVGVVERYGSGLLARRLKGKRVALLAGPPNGAWQDYTVVDAKRCVVVPDSMSDEQAAMYFINPLSAYIMVHEILKVKKGEWLMISAAGSALGKMVVRMGVEFGFNTLCIVRGSDNTDQLRGLGATAVVETDSHDLFAEVVHHTGGMGIDKAMDCVGGDLASDMIKCMGINGHMVLYGTLADEPIIMPSRDLMTPVSRLSGFFMPNWMAQQNPLKLLWILRQAGKLSKKGVFQSSVEAVYPLEDYMQAIESTLKIGRVGKTLLKIS